MTDPTSITDEIKAMQRLVVVLDKLDVDVRNRVIVWAFDRYYQRKDSFNEIQLVRPPESGHVS